MITLENIARAKVRLDQVMPVAEPAYDHLRQQRWDQASYDGLGVYMKSSTAFDGEKDNGGDDK
jgi:hypothetical protein